MRRTRRVSPLRARFVGLRPIPRCARDPHCVLSCALRAGAAQAGVWLDTTTPQGDRDGRSRGSSWGCDPVAGCWRPPRWPASPALADPRLRGAPRPTLRGALPARRSENEPGKLILQPGSFRRRQNEPGKLIQQPGSFRRRQNEPGNLIQRASSVKHDACRWPRGRDFRRSYETNDRASFVADTKPDARLGRISPQGAGQHAVRVPSAARDGPKAHKAGCCGLTLRVCRIEATSFSGFMTLQHKNAVNYGFLG